MDALVYQGSSTGDARGFENSTKHGQKVRHCPLASPEWHTPSSGKSIKLPGIKILHWFLPYEVSVNDLW